MSLLQRRAIVLAKIETTYGVDSVPVAGTDDILVRNLTPRPSESSYVGRDLVRPYLGNSPQLPAAISAGLEFEVELAGAGAAGTAPRWGRLLRACGFSETLSAGVSATYAPVSTGFESITLYANIDGVLHRITGARGSARFALNALGIPVIRFRFVGIYNAPTDTPQGTPTFNGWQQPLPVNRVNTPTFTLHSYAGVLQAIEADIANQVEFRSLVGFEGVLITDRQGQGSISMEATTIAQKDWWTSIRNATLGALQMVHGTVAGNIIELASGSAQITNPTLGESQGIVMLNANLQFVPTGGGNNDLTIIAR